MPRKPLEEIEQLYYRTTEATVERDLARAIELFKTLPEAARARAAVYMDGLSQMRSEWRLAGRRTTRPKKKSLGKKKR